MSTDKKQNLQDTFLNSVRRVQDPFDHLPGQRRASFRGVVTWFDNFFACCCVGTASPNWFTSPPSRLDHPAQPVQLYEPSLVPTREPRLSPFTPNRYDRKAPPLPARHRQSTRASDPPPVQALMGGPPATATGSRGPGPQRSISRPSSPDPPFPLKQPGSRLLIGGGKDAEIAPTVRAWDEDRGGGGRRPAPPVQQRSLERAWNAKVSRPQRADPRDLRPHRARPEGKLQVELARLEYERSRLVRTWTHLGAMGRHRSISGGLGETQIDTDCRLIADWIVRLKKPSWRRCASPAACTASSARRSVPRRWPWFGYSTNAGKSTSVRNLLADGVRGLRAGDRRCRHPGHDQRTIRLLPGRAGGSSPTLLGFISDLPHELVELFRATPEEGQGPT